MSEQREIAELEAEIRRLREERDEALMIRPGNPCGWCGETKPHRHKSGCYETLLNTAKADLAAYRAVTDAAWKVIESGTFSVPCGHTNVHVNGPAFAKLRTLIVAVREKKV